MVADEEPGGTNHEADTPRHQLEKELLLEVSQAISSTLDLPLVLQIIADGTARLLGVETAAVYLLEGDQLYLGATTPPLDPSLPETLRWASVGDHPHIQDALESRLPVVLADAPRSALSPAERAIVDMRSLRSLLYLPFCLAQTPIGVLILGTTTGEHAFDAREVNLCRTITNQLAVSVQNARLHTSLKRYASELEQQMAEQQRLEQHLRQAQKMEAVGQLAGGIAHDFNNLLQVMHGFTGLAREELRPDSSAYEALGFVLQATERAGLLVRQLLAFGRRQVLSLAIVDLNQIVDNLMPMLRPLLRENINIERHAGMPIDAVEADPNQLEQVLVNLCVNARDAMPDGGTLVVTTESVIVGERQCRDLGLPCVGAYVILEVSDTGCGMTAETQAHVFEPFFTTKGPGHGTGLGLATVHGLVAQHRGAIHIDSKVGRGTRMKVYLPVATARKQDTVLAQLPSASHGSETILVAEDEPMVLELTRASLAAAGYKVFSAANGVEALGVIELRAQQIDLAILDVVMPQLGGDAVLRRLRELRPGIPVVFASGYGRKSPAIPSQREGTAFLQKPYGREELLRKVRELLDGSS